MDFIILSYWLAFNYILKAKRFHCFVILPLLANIILLKRLLVVIYMVKLVA